MTLKDLQLLLEIRNFNDTSDRKFGVKIFYASNPNSFQQSVEKLTKIGLVTEVENTGIFRLTKEGESKLFRIERFLENMK
jgi:predicted transcriptional regulator